MNTRGLTEIAVLQAGLSAGILSSGLFLSFVLMALVTTAATGPLCRTRTTAPDTGIPPRPTSEELSHDNA